MAASRKSSGTLSSGSHSIGTTWSTLAAITDAGAYQARVSLVNMAIGDVVEIRITSKLLSADGAEELCYFFAFADAQVVPTAILPADLAVDGYTLEIRQRAGTARTFRWAVFQP